MKLNKQRVEAYEEMRLLTAPKCGGVRCGGQGKRPHRCCSPEYCEMAFAEAEAQGELLTKTDHPSLPLMGPLGCTAPAHLRPLCTLHVCTINSLGFDPEDPTWTQRYFELRQRLNAIEFNILTARKEKKTRTKEIS